MVVCHNFTRNNIMCAVHTLLKAQCGKANVDMTPFSLTFSFHRIPQNASHSGCSHIIFKTNVENIDCYTDYPAYFGKQMIDSPCLRNV